MLKVISLVQEHKGDYLLQISPAENGEYIARCTKKGDCMCCKKPMSGNEKYPLVGKESVNSFVVFASNQNCSTKQSELYLRVYIFD